MNEARHDAPPGWLEVHRGDAPLIVSLPHTGSDIPQDIESRLVGGWLARKDADWWVHRLYDFVRGMGATTVRTALSRTVVDVNRDPSGASLYPGQATTALCPLETFDGEALYAPGRQPDAAEIDRRRARYFQPYHQALAAQIARLRERHGAVVLYEAHSIRSRVPRLFDGLLPNLNIGTNGGASCAPALTAAVESACERGDFTRVTDGRFRGGWITRHYAAPARGVHALQMELACRGYLAEPEGAATPENWPVSYQPAAAAAMRATLEAVMRACLAFAEQASRRPT